MKDMKTRRSGSRVSTVAVAAILVLLAAVALSLEGCRVGEGGGKERPAGVEVGARYVCPMHPEVVSDEQGKCPKCGMNLEPKK